ncbi:hypothetical protein MJO28_013309 [Puccinia striiformis f. sp. tritici]|nr:hypothetical protein Pst134EA_024232 [Puccinia striiformis f. sp. tritici]KAI9606694.1 hypothetical protein H4Q26_006231 [Puccinia striiformis f. sp. tritici PST-130]KNF04575.1 hypothetical protein PSTG_02485 [Puccinia striiformis f. sp. tritici PST-78]POV97388.1 hypothetical protein PSHT_14614 [Puccinia striiformis]KAH9444668.1 hypothetical protein Pst134EB_024925 [Puccinia striiformis f. sp. tritici]KAH9453355.1 hypothetical protein Pst134EA_024232 [Puccinia striiformis f. sp. tritici]
MRFSSFFNICALLLIQSEVTYSTFVCNDNSIENAKVGICLRKINRTTDPNDKSLPVLDKNDVLVIAATRRSEDHFTCKDLPIGQGGVEGRYCCNLPKPKTIDAYSQATINAFCITRDAPKKTTRR